MGGVGMETMDGWSKECDVDRWVGRSVVSEEA